jgi:hypothetical protein
MRVVSARTKLTTFDVVQPGDGPLLLKFRTSPAASTLKAIPAGVEEQESYISSYVRRYETGDEAYFKVRDLESGNYVGLVRVFGLTERHTFNWGSLLFSGDYRPVLPIDVIIAVYAIGFEYFGKSLCGPFPVRNDAERVLRLHHAIGMTDVHGIDGDGTSHLICSFDKFMERQVFYRKRGLGIIESLEFHA